MGDIYQEFLDQANRVFAVIFNIECIMKLIAMGKGYFSSAWNQFDFLVVLGTNIGILITLIDPTISVGTVATIVRAFRIMRVFRLIRASKNLKVLLDTLVYILPSLANIGSLIFLLFFIFSVLGMNLFSGVMLQDQINENVNFQNFGLALLLLMRCATGENWNFIMTELALSGSYNGVPCV